MRLFSYIFSGIIGAIFSPVFIKAQPNISSFTPLSAEPGAIVILTGTNFNNIPASNIVFFGATKATVTSASATNVTVTVPSGASYAPISLLNTGTGLAAYSRSNFIPIFSPSKTSIVATDFLFRQDFTTGIEPQSLTIGDLDGDGKPDLVVANYSSNTISVYHNTATNGIIDAGSFASKVDFATGLGTYSVAIGDLDGDGKPDLAVANESSNTVSIFRNTATIGSIDASSFATKVDFVTGSDPISVAIGDLDGDGKPDLAVANNFSSSVSVFRNTSLSGSIDLGSFAVKVDFMIGSLPIAVAIGDLDGDGKPDLAISNSSNTVSVLRNTAINGSITAGSFAEKVNFATGSRPASVAIGDLDGDGVHDLAVANYNSISVSVLRNTSTIGSIGAGSFAAKVDFATGSSPYSLAIGDLDGDGKPDLAVANENSNTISVLRNTTTSGSIGTGSFTAKVDFATGLFPYSVAIGDLNGDGKPDLAVANIGSASFSVLPNAGNPVYTFTGSGNWDVASNWSGNNIPPSNLPANAQIIVNPEGSSECILNIPVTVTMSSSITVAPGKKFIIQGNLMISNQ